MAFVQIIEIPTTRPDEVEALVSEWRTRTTGRRTAQRGTFTQDRDRPNTYLQIVEFGLLRGGNVQLGPPRDGVVAQSLAQLCDGPMVFRNLDVRRVEEM